jgi:pyruvate ferredoxin oxidoreductase alpha subunit
MAYRLSEDERVRLPVIVNMDGFYLSFTREPVNIPDPEAVRRFLPPFDPENLRFRASSPMSEAVVVLGGAPYSYFRYETHLAALNAVSVYEEITEAFNQEFARQYETLERYRTDDADIVFFMIGSFATKAKDAVDRLRDAGQSVGLLRPRLLRPFPTDRVRSALSGKKGVAVIDKNLSVGKGGVLHAELASVLYGQPDAPPALVSFIGGLGGRDISAEEFYEMASITLRAYNDGKMPAPRLLYTKEELMEIRKLQTIAQIEKGRAGRKIPEVT